MNGNRTHRGRKDYHLLLAAAPFIAYFLLFRYVPLAGWSLAFYDYHLGLRLNETPFVGFGNLVAIILDYRYLAPILLNTVAMSGLLLLNAPLAILMALSISEVRSRRTRGIVQTTTTLPHFVSMVIVYSLFFAMFSSSGVVNTVLLRLGLISRPLDVLGSSQAAWFVQFGISVWKHGGWNAIIYLAAVAGIDQELYDAVSIDGGGRFRRIWHVTLPGILPTFLVVMLLSVSRILSNGGLWEQVFVFMNPLVQPKLEILDYYIYRMGIVTGDFSHATAMGLLNSAVGIGLLFGVNALARRIRGVSIL
jgi:ABC-type polysaccharide transport system permease subunit